MIGRQSHRVTKPGKTGVGRLFLSFFFSFFLVALTRFSLSLFFFSLLTRSVCGTLFCVLHFYFYICNFPFVFVLYERERGVGVAVLALTSITPVQILYRFCVERCFTFAFRRHKGLKSNKV